MNLEQFKKAKKIAPIVENIDKLISINNVVNAPEDKQIFMKNSIGSYFEIGGRANNLFIAEHKDGSGAKYELTEPELESIQRYVYEMLKRRKVELQKQLDKI